MSNVERTISYCTAGVVVLVSLMLLMTGPLAAPQAAEACSALEAMAPEQLDTLLERLAADPERPASLDAATLTRCGAGELPAEALPCLQERLDQHLASRLSSARNRVTRWSSS
jgi:hypothetical protein